MSVCRSFAEDEHYIEYALEINGAQKTYLYFLSIIYGIVMTYQICLLKYKKSSVILCLKGWMICPPPSLLC